MMDECGVCNGAGAIYACGGCDGIPDGEAQKKSTDAAVKFAGVIIPDMNDNGVQTMLKSWVATLPVR